MLSNLYHADEVCGTATVGSSEAILLGGLAMKRRWQERYKDAGKTPSGKPNMVCSSAVHVCWEKLFNYFDIEARYVNLTEDCFVAPPEKARPGGGRAGSAHGRRLRGRERVVAGSRNGTCVLRALAGQPYRAHSACCPHPSAHMTPRRMALMWARPGTALRAGCRAAHPRAAAARTAGGGARLTRPRRRADRGAVRREHHRRGGHPGHDLLGPL